MCLSSSFRNEVILTCNHALFGVKLAYKIKGKYVIRRFSDGDEERCT